MAAEKSGAIQISFYVNFVGRAKEAMELYHQLLGGNLDHREGQYRLGAEGVVILGVEGSPAYPAKAGENMALSVSGTDRHRLTMIFDGLAVGGTIKMPLKAQGGLGEVGWLTDKFGINWTISIEGVSRNSGAGEGKVVS